MSERFSIDQTSTSPRRRVNAMRDGSKLAPLTSNWMPGGSADIVAPERCMVVMSIVSEKTTDLRGALSAALSVVDSSGAIGRNVGGTARLADDEVGAKRTSARGFAGSAGRLLRSVMAILRRSFAAAVRTAVVAFAPPRTMISARSPGASSSSVSPSRGLSSRPRRSGSPRCRLRVRR